MKKSKAGLLDGVILDYTTTEGTPTIKITANLTTRNQVGAVVEQLNKLALVLPEVTVRSRAKKVTTTRAPRIKNSDSVTVEKVS